MTTQAKGSFEVKMTPQAWSESSADQTLGRFLLDKQYHGDLEATSQGQMLSAGTAEKGSAGYVAIEKLNGTLHGRTGSFVLQHNGVMDRGTPQLTIAIVPDSGTGELQGLAGAMTIQIADGRHSYELAYTLVTIQ
jgi:Protein of unknown function (DUF3224)